MEVGQNSVTVTLSCRELTCAAETLTTLVSSALVKAHLVPLGSIGLMLTSETHVKSEHISPSNPCDAEKENSIEDEGDDDAVDGGFGEGEEDLSSEDGENYGINNNKSNPKKNPGGADAREENGEDEDDEDGDDEDDDDDDDGEDDDDDDDEEDDEDEDEDGDEEEEEGGVEEEEENEDEDEEEALQPLKKRKK